MVIRSHGSGFRAIRRDLAYNDAGSSPEMPEITGVFRSVGIGPRSRITVLGFDDCLMNMIEIVHQFKDSISIVVDYVDAVHPGRVVARDVSGPAVKNSALDLADAVDDCVIISKKHGPGERNANGLSVWFLSPGPRTVPQVPVEIHGHGFLETTQGLGPLPGRLSRVRGDREKRDGKRQGKGVEPRSRELNKTKEKPVKRTLLIVLLLSALSGRAAQADAAAGSACNIEALENARFAVYPWDPAEDTSRVLPLTDQKKSELLKYLGDLGGASWQNALLQGMADVLADRAQKELESWFLSDMLEKICSITITEHTNVLMSGTDIFPQLCTAHKTFDIALLPSRSILLAALREDIEMIPARYAFCAEKSYSGIIATNLVREIRNRQAPELLIASFGEKAFLYRVFESENDVVVKNLLAEKKDMLAFYLSGSLTQAYLTSTATQEPANFIGILTTKLTNDGLVDPKLTDAMRDASSVAVSVKSMQSRTKHIRALLSDEHPDYAAVLEEATLVGKDAVRLIEYAADLLDMQDRTGGGQRSAKKRIEQLEMLADMAAGRYQECLLKLSTYFACDNPATSGDAGSKPCRYLPALVSLAGIGNADDAKASIEALASPLGAWRLKKTGQLRWSVGSYVGVSYGRESLRSFDVSSAQKRGTVGSVFAPLGIDYEWKYPGGWFLSVLNLGNLVSQRLTNTEDGAAAVKENPRGRFSDVFSPGLYYRVRLGNSPFSWGFGGSYLYNIREVTDGSGTTKRYDAVHIDTFIAVDVTLFPL